MSKVCTLANAPGTAFAVTLPYRPIALARPQLHTRMYAPHRALFVLCLRGQAVHGRTSIKLFSPAKPGSSAPDQAVAWLRSTSPDRRVAEVPLLDLSPVNELKSGAGRPLAAAIADQLDVSAEFASFVLALPSRASAPDAKSKGTEVRPSRRPPGFAAAATRRPVHSPASECECARVRAACRTSCIVCRTFAWQTCAQATSAIVTGTAAIAARGVSAYGVKRCAITLLLAHAKHARGLPRRPQPVRSRMQCLGARCSRAHANGHLNRRKRLDRRVCRPIAEAARSVVDQGVFQDRMAPAWLHACMHRRRGFASTPSVEVSRACRDPSQCTSPDRARGRLPVSRAHTPRCVPDRFMKL